MPQPTAGLPPQITPKAQPTHVEVNRRRGEERGRRPQDLDRPAQRVDFPLELRDPLCLRGRHTGSVAFVDLGLLDTVAQSL